MATASRPTIAAFHASRSESLPSVAEIAVVSSVVNVTGRAPVWRTSARSFASPVSPMPVIWAPFVPLIPFGYCSQSIDGQDLISRSRTIAKCCVIFWPPLKFESRLPRSASSRVIVAELVRTLVGELHQHDRLTGVRVEVLRACPRA